MTRRRRRPGLAKTQGLPLLQRRNVELWQSTDYRWRELFEAADVMSEGATRDETAGPTYYGSTSILLPLQSRGGFVPDAQLADIIRLLQADPHARLRAVRVACLEAQLRARGPLGRVRAELFVRRDPRGARVDVDVEARVSEEGRVHKARGESPAGSKAKSRKRSGSR